MSNLLEAITDDLKQVFSDEELPVPSTLLGLKDKVEQLGQVSLEWSGNGIEDWLDKFRALIGDTQTRDTLLVRALQLHFPRLAEALTFLGVIRFPPQHPATGIDAFEIDWQRLNDLLNNPGPTAGDLTWWLGKIQKIDDAKLFQVYASMLFFAPMELLRLEYDRHGFLDLPSPGQPGVSLDELIHLVNSPLKLGLPPVLPLSLDDFKQKARDDAGLAGDFLSIVGPDGPALPPLFDGFGLELNLANAAGAALPAYDLGNGWRLRFSPAQGVQKTYRIFLKGNSIDTAAQSEDELEVRLDRQPSAGQSALLVGPDRGTRLEVQAAQFALRFHNPAHAGDPLFSIHASLQRTAFVLTTGYLKLIGGGLPIPDELRFESDINVGYLQGKGLQSQGSPDGTPALGAQFVAPLNFKVGTSGLSLTLDRVLVRLEARPEGDQLRMRALLRYGASARFGPLTIQMDGAGAWFGRWTGNQAGALLPPDGFGLSVDAGPVSGGGFLKRLGEDEFAGALELKLLGMGVFAYGIYKKLPGGEPSFIALIGVRFPLPGIQIGFGFAISGIGGLVGVNRRADTDLLRDRLASGASGQVLFCDDPVKNAPSLLNDMRAFFPDEAGVFLVGPTFQINWLELLRLDLGLFVELPGPRKVFLAGSARMVIGTSDETALVYLRIDFVGGMDMTRQLIFFDAALVHSHVMQVFNITGGVALRLGYGPGGYFLFSVGGFNPSFNPGPLALPRLARAGVSMSVSAVGNAWFKLEMYLALTPNTLQLGARAEAGLELGPISAHGWFVFDSLIQFRPFHFEASIDASFDVEVEGVSLYGVRLEGDMTGPGPIVVNARASVKILFARVSGSVTLRLGSDSADRVEPIADLVTLLRPELTDPHNLRAEGEDNSVVFRPQPSRSAGLPLIAPVGALIWEQKRAPLGRDIERLEGVDLVGAHHLQLVAKDINSVPEQDWFSLGSYVRISDSQALNTSRFVMEQSGLRVDAKDPDAGTAVPYTIMIVLWKLPDRLRLSDLASKVYMVAGFAAMQRERNTFTSVHAGEPLVKTQAERWNTYDVKGRTVAEGQSSAQAFMTARRDGGVAAFESDRRVDLQGVF